MRTLQPEGVMDVWVNLFQTVGLAVMIIIAGGYGLWRMIGWIGKEVVIPIRDNLIGAMKQQMMLVEKQWESSHKERDVERDLRHKGFNGIQAAISEVRNTTNDAKDEILEKLPTVCRYGMETNRRGPRQSGQIRHGDPEERTPT